jgi:hypothetical protein
MNLFLLDAIPLDTDLVSKYPQLVKLADDNAYRGKEAMKLILINLYKGHRRGRAIRYSRDKAFYAAGTRYHEIWFKYDRVIDIIDVLKTLGYADFKDGLHYPDDNVGGRSEIRVKSGTQKAVTNLLTV